MDRKYIILLLIVVYCIGVGIRFSAIQGEQTFHDAQSYTTYHGIEKIKQGEHIQNEDQYRFGGKEQPGFQLTSYIYAFFTWPFESIFAIKLFHTLISLLCIPLVFLIIEEVTKKSSLALFSSSLLLFIPGFITNTLHTIQTNMVAIGFLLLALYYFMNTRKEEEKKSTYYIVSVIILSALSPLALILCLTFLLFELVRKTEKIRVRPFQRDALLFTVILSIWSVLIFHKKAVLAHGIDVLWRNTPLEIQQNQLSAVLGINIIEQMTVPLLLLALLGLYLHLFNTKNERLTSSISFFIVISVLFFWRILDNAQGYILLSISLVIFFAFGCSELQRFYENTKLSKYKKYIETGFSVFCLVLIIMPAYAAYTKPSSVSIETIQAIEWLKKEKGSSHRVAGTLEEGHLLASIGEQKTIADTDFLFITDGEKRRDDLQLVYTSSSLIIAAERLEEYNTTFILVDSAKEVYEIDTLLYENASCLEKIYDKNNISIFETQCRVTKTQKEEQNETKEE